MEINVTQKVVNKVNLKNLKFSAKCSDSFSCYFYDDKGQEILDYEGYVPGFFPGKHYGDYVELDIDLATGKILNWSATKEQLQAFITKHGEEAENG